MRNYYLNTRRVRAMFRDPVVEAVITSFVTIVVVLGIVFGLAWHYRAKVFALLAKNISKDLAVNENTLVYQPEVKSSGDEPQVTIPKEYSVVDAVKIAKPAVVSIVESKEVPKYDVSYQQQDLGLGFSVQTPDYVQNGTEKKEVGSGSGFIISADGLIVTNRHVVADKDGIYEVQLNSGKKYPAKVLARDLNLDVAVIKIQASSLPYLSFADSDSLEVGQSVVAIGNALGEFKNSVSVGVVSGLSRSLVAGGSTGQSEQLDKVIQTDAAINPGNSGGPLLNLEGQVVGINVATVIGSSNIGFSIPINSVKNVISSVVKTGIIVRPYVGIRYLPISPEVKDKFKLSVDYGILVAKGEGDKDPSVVPGGPADKAGIVDGDVILEVNGQKINSDFSAIIRGKKVGDSVTFKVLSKGVEKTVTLKLEQPPADL